jgi:hypothetical protein
VKKGRLEKLGVLAVLIVSLALGIPWAYGIYRGIPSGKAVSFALLCCGAVLAVCLYFLPSIIGYKKKNFMAIFLLNLLLGWTFIGWVAALVWAVMVEKD